MQVTNGYRLPKPEGCQKDVYDVMFNCWKEDSHDRPTFLEMATFFRKKYRELNPDEGGQFFDARLGLCGRFKQP